VSRRNFYDVFQIPAVTGTIRARHLFIERSCLNFAQLVDRNLSQSLSVSVRDVGWFVGMVLSDRIFGFLLDWSMSSNVITRERTPALKDAHGEVLELGFGTALNLACLPDSVRRLTMVDPENLMPKLVAERFAAAHFPVQRATLSAEHLPFEDDRFDSVVSTFTLCTIPDVTAALREVRRVLKPGGSLLFLEHGLSEEPNVAKWQRRLDPIQSVIGRGCHLTRRIDQLVSNAGLEMARLDRYVIAGKRKARSTMYRGTAIARK
jgi:SAM-dependent methyltransferase